MTQALVLSNDSQRRILEEADADTARARKGAKKNLLWSLGAFAATAAVALVFPPAGLATVAMVATSIVGLLTGVHAAGHFLNERTLGNIKKEIKDDSFVDKMKNRDARISKFARIASKVSDYGLFGAIGMAAAAFLFPPVAPVAWALYSAGIYTMAAGTFANSAARESERSATKLNRLTQALAPHDSLKAVLEPSNQNKPSGLSNTPSPSAEFDKAANGNTPEAAAETPKKAPVLKP